MERTEVLKSVGFSDKFLQALHEFEKAVPNVFFENPVFDNITEYNEIDISGHIIIDQISGDYNQNVIVQQY